MHAFLPLHGLCWRGKYVSKNRQQSPAFSASRLRLAEASALLAFLAFFAFFSSLVLFCSSFLAWFLAQSSLSSGTRGRAYLTTPIPCKQTGVKTGAKKGVNEAKSKMEKTSYQ